MMKRSVRYILWVQLEGVPTVQNVTFFSRGEAKGAYDLLLAGKMTGKPQPVEVESDYMVRPVTFMADKIIALGIEHTEKSVEHQARLNALNTVLFEQYRQKYMSEGTGDAEVEETT